MASLLAKLSHSLGSYQAAIEINWMRQAARAPHDLVSMVNRRAHGEPLQYILGTQPFGPLTLLTRPPTLIPRPETEQWTSDLADKLWKRSASPHTLKVLDLCTGSGCILLLLCHLLGIKGIQVAGLGVDVSTAACQLARDNIASIDLSPGSSLNIGEMNIFDVDFWESVKKSVQMSTLHRSDGLLFDVVTANPPYIPKDQWQRLPPEVKNWEDPAALLGDPFPHGGDEVITSPRGDKGLRFYERIRDLLSFRGILSAQGVLVMEIGDGQAEDVVKIFNHKFSKVEVWKDLWDKERAVFLYGED